MDFTTDIRPKGFIQCNEILKVVDIKLYSGSSLTVVINNKAFNTLIFIFHHSISGLLMTLLHGIQQSLSYIITRY